MNSVSLGFCISESLLKKIKLSLMPYLQTSLCIQSSAFPNTCSSAITLLLKYIFHEGK